MLTDSCIYVIQRVRLSTLSLMQSSSHFASLLYSLWCYLLFTMASCMAGHTCVGAAWFCCTYHRARRFCVHLTLKANCESHMKCDAIDHRLECHVWRLQAIWQYLQLHCQSENSWRSMCCRQALSRYAPTGHVLCNTLGVLLWFFVSIDNKLAISLHTSR